MQQEICSNVVKAQARFAHTVLRIPHVPMDLVSIPIVFLIASGKDGMTVLIPICMSLSVL